MDRTRTSPAASRGVHILLIAGLVVIASVMVAVALGGSRPALAADLPATTSSPVPVVTPLPTANSSADPREGGIDAMPIRVEIDVIGDDEVHVDIVDETGTVVGGSSGPAAHGPSVEAYTLEVEQADADTLRLTWIDYAIDNALELHVFDNDGVLQLVMIQPEPTTDVDAMAFDRILFLDFNGPISADDVEAWLQDGMDTPGTAGYENE
jgi:hypothetical protein